MKIRTSSPRSFFTGACFLFLTGFVLLAIAGTLTWRTSAYIQRSQTAEGTITSLVPVTNHDDNGGTSTSYAPVFSFTSADGKTLSVQSTVSSNPPGFVVNGKVTVLYDPADPQHARIDTFGQLWFVPVLLASMGTVFFIIASIFVFALRRFALRRAITAPPQTSIP